MKQTRICFTQSATNERYLNFNVWQPEITDSYMKPWACHVEGWESDLTITIYHESFTRGKLVFTNCKFRNARHFAEFVSKMLRLQSESFKKPIKISGNDCLELMSEYRKGIEKAKQIYIDEVFSQVERK